MRLTSFCNSYFDGSTIGHGFLPDDLAKDVVQNDRKKGESHYAGDFRPIANVRLLYKTFCYMKLGRLEHACVRRRPTKRATWFFAHTGGLKSICSLRNC